MDSIEYYQIESSNIYIRIIQIGEQIIKTRLVISDMQVNIETLHNWEHGGAITKIRKLKQVKPEIFFTLVAEALIKARLVSVADEKPEMELEIVKQIDLFNQAA